MKEMLEKYLDDEDDMKSIHLSAKCAFLLKGRLLQLFKQPMVDSESMALRAQVAGAESSSFQAVGQEIAEGNCTAVS